MQKNKENIFNPTVQNLEKYSSNSYMPAAFALPDILGLI